MPVIFSSLMRYNIQKCYNTLYSLNIIYKYG